MRLTCPGGIVYAAAATPSQTVIGSGLTRSKAEQLAVLSDNAAKAVERYLLDNPQWFPAPAAP